MDARFPGLQKTNISIQLAHYGPPVILNWNDLEEKPCSFVTVIPLDGKDTDPVLFAFYRANASNVARLGAATSPTAGYIWHARPVITGNDLGIRLWERGSHVGDVEVAGRKDVPVSKGDGVQGYMTLAAGGTISFAAHGKAAAQIALLRPGQPFSAVARTGNWRGQSQTTIIDIHASLEASRPRTVSDENTR